MKKVNPNKKPRTEADVKRAFEKGVNVGISNANVIFLTVLADKYGFDTDRIADFWVDVCKLSEEIAEGMVSISDLKNVLKEEYKIKA